jgi:hypothetical protein
MKTAPSLRVQRRSGNGIVDGTGAMTGDTSVVEL